MVIINNYELGVYIDDYLVKNKIREYDINDLNRFFVFEDHEISHVDSLTLNGVNSLKDIEKLTNLKYLNISNVKDTKLPLDIDFNFSNEINHIKDFSKLEKLKSLQTLIICNDFHIDSLDLKNLNSLKQLILINNKSLSNIFNIELLKKLKFVIIVGNKVKTINDWNKYIKNTKSSYINLLDTTLMIDMFRKKEDMSAYISESNIKFAESVGFLNLSVIDKTKALMMYKYALDLYKKLDKSSKYKYISSLYEYIINNINYDDDNLLRRNKIYNKLMQKKGIINNKYGKYLNYMNSSASALIKQKSVCEGYVQLMKYMLSFVNINSEIVYCSDYDSNEYNHAALKIYYNNKWYYFDPEWEQRNNCDYFFKTKEEFEKTHKLNARENFVYYKKRK